MMLRLYIARRFVLLTVLITVVFTGLLLPIDLAEHLRDLEGSARNALHLSALNLPAALYQILPLIVILATLALFLGLARTSELVVIRGAGRSALWALWSPVLAALLLGGVALLAVNPIVAATQKAYERVEARLSGISSTLSITEEDVWLRQGDAEGQTVIRASRASLDGTVLFGATFLRFDGAGTPIQRIDAARAELGVGAWQLSDAKTWPLAEVQNPEAVATLAETASLPSTLTRAQIRDSFGTPSAIPIYELPAFIARLDAAGFSARTHRVWFHMEIANPVLLAAMVMVGAAFTMRHQRGGRTGAMVLAALLTGFGVFFLRNFAQVLGENGQLPILVAAWAPPVAAILAATGLILHLEDG